MKIKTIYTLLRGKIAKIAMARGVNLADSWTRPSKLRMSDQNFKGIDVKIVTLRSVWFHGDDDSVNDNMISCWTQMNQGQ